MQDIQIPNKRIITTRKNLIIYLPRLPSRKVMATQLGTLGDVADIKIADKMEGDFYLRRVSGTASLVGEPRLKIEGNPNNWIAIKVKRTDVIVPKFLYYWFEMAWGQKMLMPFVTGSVQQYMKISDLKKIQLQPR